MTELPWWRGAAIYQVYVRSFFDSNGDGHGDLRGVTAKLDYIQSLGVDGIWLSPIHPSPDRDWGYDVSDYDGVHPDFGDLADLDALLEAAHARGLKVLLDEVLAHTSDQHPWFVESRKGAAGDKADWYVWADPRPDGTAPNNWLTVFGSPGWTYDPQRRQHFHHKFMRDQPKLSWVEPAAREAALAVLDLWLERGVDGFRLDMAGAFLHDPALTDNPAVPLAERTAGHWSNPYRMQRSWFDANLPENLELMDAVRRRVERWPGRFVFGECNEEPERGGGLAAPDEGLHSAYTIPLLLANRTAPGDIRRWADWLAGHPRHWPCVAFCNHDVPRTVSRFAGGADPAVAKLMLAILLTLRGTALIYQGEELGLPEAELPRDQMKDHGGVYGYPASKGRDGCRTPMPWRSGAPHLGFSTAAPWLPAASEHAGLTVEAQEADAGSTLAFTRALIATRRDSAALKWGEIAFEDAPSPLLVFHRRHGGETVICVFNMGAQAARWSGQAGKRLGPECGSAHTVDGGVELGAHAAWIGWIGWL
jgi:alpha-glucosidase